ncbi:hypothetical protein D3C76_1781140 [compost metagenome]
MEKRVLDIYQPFPSYIYRLLISQAEKCDEHLLRGEHKMSRAALIRKIEKNFTVDKNRMHA